MSRLPNTQPATAYNYRRYIVLVQALALGDWKAILALCDAWEVKPTIYYPTDPTDGSRYIYDKADTIAHLAKSAIDHKQEANADDHT